MGHVIVIGAMRVKAKDFYVLLCDDSKYNEQYDPMVCGVFSTRKEAQDCAKDVKDCLLKHVIKKCSVTVDFYAGQQQRKRHKARRAPAQSRKNGSKRA